MRKELIQGFDGYNEIITEIQVLRKYGIDYTLDKGSVEAVSYTHLTLPTN